MYSASDATSERACSDAGPLIFPEDDLQFVQSAEMIGEHMLFGDPYRQMDDVGRGCTFVLPEEPSSATAWDCYLQEPAAATPWNHRKEAFEHQGAAPFTDSAAPAEWVFGDEVATCVLLPASSPADVANKAFAFLTAQPNAALVKVRPGKFTFTVAVFPDLGGCPCYCTMKVRLYQRPATKAGATSELVLEVQRRAGEVVAFAYMFGQLQDHLLGSPTAPSTSMAASTSAAASSGAQEAAFSEWAPACDMPQVPAGPEVLRPLLDMLHHGSPCHDRSDALAVLGSLAEDEQGALSVSAVLEEAGLLHSLSLWASEADLPTAHLAGRLQTRLGQHRALAQGAPSDLTGAVGRPQQSYPVWQACH